MTAAQRVQGGVNQDPSGRTPAKPTVVVTQAVAGPAARLLVPNRAPAGTRTTSHGFAFARLAPGGATITQLAEHLGVTRQAAAQLVDELIAKGYAQRSRHPDDARARLITLTDRGCACTRAAEAAVADTVRPWAALLSEERLRALQGDLLRIAPHGPLRPTW